MVSDIDIFMYANYEWCFREDYEAKTTRCYETYRVIPMGSEEWNQLTS